MNVKSYFLDTSFLIDLMNEREKALDIHEDIKGTEITGTLCVYELSKFTEFDVKQLFNDKEVLEFTITDAEEAGDIYYELSNQGSLIGEMDMVIGGMVRNRGFSLVTRDDDFKKIKGIDLRFY